MTDEVKTYSYSQMRMYSRCGEQYRRRYIEGEKRPPGLFMHVGTGVHVGAEVNGAQKIESHEDMPVDDIVEAAVTGFENRIEGDGYAVGGKLDVGEAKDQTAQLANVYAVHAAPLVQPNAVELKLTASFGECNLTGVIDYTEEDDSLGDYKTAGAKMPANSAMETIQGSTYNTLFFAEFGRLPKTFRLDAIIKTKKPYHQRLESKPNMADVEIIERRVTATHRGIQAGIFTPATDNPMACNQRMCGYWDDCPYVNHGRKE